MRFAVRYRYDRFLIAALNMNMGLVMFSIIEVIHQDEDAVEHRNDWQR